MAYSWHDIKLSTMQKLFSASGTTNPTDESTVDYIAAMPYACNEALNLLSTSGKFIIKSFEIAHYPIDNLIDDDTVRKISEYTYIGDGALSYYFEASGTGTCNIYVGDTLLSAVAISSTAYTSFKANIANAGGHTVKLVFAGTYPLCVKNVAMYAQTFTTDDSVQPFNKFIKYSIDSLVDDFYQLDDAEAYFEGAGEEKYIQIKDYFQEGNKTIVLPRSMKGNFRIYYKAYPTQITSATEDSYILPIDPEVAVIIPLYMASQLYKDDDNGIATSYRNEFEAAREALSNKANVPVAESFTSESGWI